MGASPPLAFPRWIYHLALEEDWQQAKRQGFYDRSTRHASLAEVGFIHCCTAAQLEGVRQRFYADLADHPGRCGCW